MNYFNNEERAAKAFAEFEAAGCEGAMIRANVTDEDEVNRLVAEATEKLGPLDIVVLNATPDQPLKPIEEYDWDFYQSMLDFFIKSPYLVTRAVLPHMKQRQYGRIVNMASALGLVAIPNRTPYATSKGGVVQLTRALALELAGSGITVNALCPGFLETEMTEGIVANSAEMTGMRAEEARKSLEKMSPQWHLIQPSEVSAAALWLCAPGSEGITGQAIAIAGGEV